MKTERSHKMIALYIVIGLAVLASLSYVIFVTFDKEWKRDGDIITNGSVSYEIGDYYEYDETNVGTVKDVNNVKWKVLGVDKSGNLLIVSASNVSTIKLGNKEDLNKSKKDYINGIDKLNEEASKYAKGFNALYARSINLSDLQKLVNYSEPKKDFYSYYWTEENNPYVESVYESKVSETNHNGEFLWYDSEIDDWKLFKKDADETLENKELIVSIKSDLITFDNKLDNLNIKRYSSEDKIYKMIYQDEEGKKADYWLADKFTNSMQDSVGYGYNVMTGETLNYSHLLYSSQTSSEYSSGLRVVVAIK